MHTLVVTNKVNYKDHMELLVDEVSNNYEKACYISFTDPYHIVIEMLENANIHENKFVVVDATSPVEKLLQLEAKKRTTYVFPVNSLFNMYMFLRGVIIENEVKMMLIDSVSALIEKHNEINLKGMLTNLLLEIGTRKCDSSIVVFNEHIEHEVVKHLEPFIAKNRVLY